MSRMELRPLRAGGEEGFWASDMLVLRGPSGSITTRVARVRVGCGWGGRKSGVRAVRVWGDERLPNALIEPHTGYGHQPPKQIRPQLYCRDSGGFAAFGDTGRAQDVPALCTLCLAWSRSDVCIWMPAAPPAGKASDRLSDDLKDRTRVGDDHLVAARFLGGVERKVGRAQHVLRAFTVLA